MVLPLGERRMAGPRDFAGGAHPPAL